MTTASAPRRMLVRCWLLAGLGAAVLAARLAGGQAAPSPPAATVEQYLRSVGVGESPLRAADAGQAVVRLLKTDDNRDVAVFGMIAVRAPLDTIVARTVAAHGFILAQASRTGVFGGTPTVADLAGVGFDHAEYRGLRHCHPGDCDFKLPAAAMQAFANDVDWSSPNAESQANDLLRGFLLRLVTDYEARGNAALPTYDDGPGVSAAAAFEAVLAQSAPTLRAFAPDLERYLTSYPSGRPPTAQDFVHWWETRLPRMRPTLAVEHVVLDAPPNGTAFVARKQVYANHYFEAALELIAILDGGASRSAPVTYLVTIRRFRFDYLPGGLLNVRGRVRSHLLDATRDDLLRERAVLERDP